MSGRIKIVCASLAFQVFLMAVCIRLGKFGFVYFLCAVPIALFLSRMFWQFLCGKYEVE